MLSKSDGAFLFYKFTNKEVKVAKVEQTSQERLKAIYGGLFVKAKEEE